METSLTQHSFLRFLPGLCEHGVAAAARRGKKRRIEAKTDASIFAVGGCESRRWTATWANICPVKWSHKHCDCSRLPLAGDEHRRGIMWRSTSWYHGALILLATSFTGPSWGWDMEEKPGHKPANLLLGCMLLVSLCTLCHGQKSKRNISAFFVRCWLFFWLQFGQSWIFHWAAGPVKGPESVVLGLFLGCEFVVFRFCIFRLQCSWKPLVAAN